MTTYRLFAGVDGPGGQNTDTTNYTLGVEFYVDTPCWVTTLHFWASTARDGTYVGRIFTVDSGGTTGTAVAGTDVTFGPITAGWNPADLDRALRLTPGQRYRAAVHFTTDNGYTSTTDYWSTGPGAAGITSGPLHAPNATNARGARQGTFTAGPTIAFPSTVSSAGNYWVDVTVSDTDPDTVNASLYAVDRTTGALTALPHFSRLAVSEVRNGIGKVEVDYPVYGLNFDLLAANTVADRDLEVEVWLVGRQGGALRGVLTDTAGDDLTEDAVWRFEGWDLNVLLDEVLVWPQTGADKQELILSAATAGSIVADLITQAQGRGALTGVTAGFTTGLDSAGAAWATVVTATFSPSATLLDVLQELIEIGMIDGFRLGGDRVLRMWNPNGQGTDRTTTTPPVIFRRGRSLTESPRRHTVRNSATTALVAGSENLYDDANDASALARRGRRIEVAGSAGSLKDTGSVAAYAQAMLATVTPGTHEVTHGLILGRGYPIPWADYAAGDWVWSDTRNTLDRLRIQQLELEYGPDGYAGSVVLNTTTTDRVSLIARKLKRISSGTAVVGTSRQEPEVDDGKAPAQVTGVTASSTSYVANGGVTLAAVTAGWTAVTTNADATPAVDIAGYIPAYRYTGVGMPTAWQVLPQVNGTFADWSGVTPGKALAVMVAAVDKFGRMGAWSNSYAFTSGTDTTAPPVPSMPVVDSYLGLLTVTWDGLGSAGEVQPPDFDRVEVHVSTSSGFTPSSLTRVDSLRAAGTIPWDGGTYGVTYFGKLIAYDKTGNASAASAQDSVVLAQAGDGDIGAVSIGKLTAGIMSAIMTISGIMRTASTGDRVEIDAAGIRCYDGTNIVFQFDIATGVAYMKGTLEAGVGNDRVIIQPSGAGASGTALPEISMYASATALPAYVNAYPTAGARVGLGLNSGNSQNSGTSRNQSTLKLEPSSLLMYVNSAPGDTAGPGVSRGGFLSATTTQAVVGCTDFNGADTALIELNSDFAIYTRGHHQIIGVAGGRSTWSIGTTNGDLTYTYAETKAHAMAITCSTTGGAGTNSTAWISAVSSTGFTVRTSSAGTIWWIAAGYGA